MRITSLKNECRWTSWENTKKKKMVVTTLTWSQTHLQDTENLPCGCPGQSGRSAGFCQTSEGEEWPEPSNMLACAGSAPGGATGPPHPISSPLPGPRAGPGTPSSATGVTPHCRAGLGSQGNYGANSAWLVGPAGPASGGNGALLRASHWSVASAGLCGQFWAFIALGISHIPCAQAEDQPESTSTPSGCHWKSLCGLCATLTPCL